MRGALLAAVFHEVYLLSVLSVEDQGDLPEKVSPSRCSRYRLTRPQVATLRAWINTSKSLSFLNSQERAIIGWFAGDAREFVPAAGDNGGDADAGNVLARCPEWRVDLTPAGKGKGEAAEAEPSGANDIEASALSFFYLDENTSPERIQMVRFIAHVAIAALSSGERDLFAFMHTAITNPDALR